jgi:hypothetical protein
MFMNADCDRSMFSVVSRFEFRLLVASTLLVLTRPGLW